MPSKLRLRERLSSLRPGSLASSRSTSPVPPPTRVQSSAPNSVPTLPPPPPPAPTENPAFLSALKIHIQGLSSDEQQAFKSSNTITPQSLLAQIKSYDETHNKTSYSRRCASRVEGFLKAVDEYLKPVQVMVGHSPQISSLVVGGVKLIVQLGLKFAAFFSKLAEMMDFLAGHLGYLSQYAECFNNSQQVQEALSSAYRDLLKFCTGARNVFVDREGNQSRWVSFRIFLRVTWEPFEEGFNTLNLEFCNHVEIVIRTAGIEEHKRLHSKEVLEAEKKEDEDRRKLLLWLSELEFDQDHDRIFSKRHQDTGNWLIESPGFSNWVDAKESSLLWCYGGPGVGKSVLASIALETISTKYSLDDRTGIAFVYFNFQEQSVQKSIKVLSTMMKQLARRKKVLPNELKQFYQKYYRDGDFPSEEKLQAQFSELSKSFDQVFLVMDAMDEFDDRKGFLPIITKFAQDSSIKFKIFVTSRRERDIENAFTKCNFPTIQIEAKKVDADIATFVRYQLEKRTGEGNGVVIDQSLKNKIADVLTSKSSGMFLWVRYQLDYIYEQPSIRDINTALNSLPYDMNATYIRILEKIDKQVPARKKIAERALKWVVGAGRPLTLKELAIAVSIEPESKCHKELEIYEQQTVLDTCCNLLTVEDGIVRPVHYTVQEFLIASRSDPTDIESTPLLRKYQFVTNDHAGLAQICLQYLLFGELRSGTIDYFSALYLTCQFEVYTATYWDYHVRILPDLPEDLANSIDRFLDAEGSSLACAYRIRNKLSNYQCVEITPLSFCLSLDLLHLFQRSHCFDTSIRDSEKYKDVLHNAARGGSTSSIETLLKIGFSVNAYDRNHQTPLHYAAGAGHKAALNILLKNGADVNAQGGEYGNALQAAAQGGHETVVRTLLDNGADVNAQGGEDGNALQAAAQGGHETVVRTLLDNGADVNAQGGFYGNALQEAAKGGHETVVRTLLDNGADVNAQGGEDGNALQAAAKGGHETVVRTLLDNGADVNAQGGEDGNALQAAAKRGRGTFSRGGRGGQRYGIPLVTFYYRNRLSFP